MNQAKPINKSSGDPINSSDDFNIHQYEPTRKKQKSIKQEAPGVLDPEGSKHPRKDRPAQGQLNEYEKKLSNYTTNGFSHNGDLFLRKLACDQSLTSLAAKYPLLKVLKVVLKKMMLNDFEIVYWVSFLEASKWNFMDLVDFSGNFPDLLTSSEYFSFAEYKALLLYLTLSAFLIKLSKQHLNEEEETSVFESYLSSIWPQFQEVYPIFFERQAFGLQVTPKVLNSVYRKFSNLEKIVENPNQFYDYNSLVDDIIHISPPYNYDRYENSTAPSFMESHLGNPNFMRKIEKTSNFNNLPSELPKLGREPSMSINLGSNAENRGNGGDLRLPSLMKKESTFNPPELFRGESFFQDLNRNDSFGGLDGFTFGLMRNSSVNSEIEGNMKFEDNSLNYNRHLLNLPPLTGINSEVEGQKGNSEQETENKNRRGKEGFKLTKSSLGHSNQSGIFHKNNSQQE